MLNTSGPADDAAFTAMYEEHYRAIRDYASLRCTAAELDDVLAEVFTVAWRRFIDIPQGMERGWLFGVVKNVLRNNRRSASRNAALRMRLTATAPRHIDPLLSGVPIDTREQLAGAFNSLSERDRDVVVLATWFDITGKELAAALGISPAAAAVRLHRARNRFQRAFDSWTEVEPS